MSDRRSLGSQVVDTVTSWPGVTASPGTRGELSLRYGRREIGHLHGDHAAHFGFPKKLWRELLDQGRIVRHPIDRDGLGARRLVGPDDVREVVALMRLNYDRAAAHTASALASPVPRLYASTPEPLPFAPLLSIRAFLLERGGGNLLVYSVAGLERDAAAIGALGGASRQYLNHRHEALFASDWVSAPLVVHERERAAVAKRHAVGETFGERHALGDDFEAIPTPGHTPGATAYLWDSGAQRILFTGDTIYLDDDEWVAAVLESSDRRAYLDSLELIRELEFDVLVPWAAKADGPYFALTDRADTRRRVDAIIERLRHGRDR
jgi:glyoxylase-like metal-dependent hydrolase (beta-lactamase superfamily II)